MKTTMKNSDVFNSLEPMKELVNIELPVKTSYAITRLVQKLESARKAIETVRLGLVKKYGESDKDNPKNIRVTPECSNWEAFVSDFNELMEVEVELDFIPVKLPLEFNGKSVAIKPGVLLLLDKFIQVDEDKPLQLVK